MLQTTKVTINSSNIKVPTDNQASLKTSLGSTTTPLSAGGVYEGSIFDASIYKYVVGAVYSDQTGTAYVEQSIDGTNWRLKESFAVTAGNVTPISATVVWRYVRITYTNDTTDQTEFEYECSLVVM